MRVIEANIRLPYLPLAVWRGRGSRSVCHDLMHVAALETLNPQHMRDAARRELEDLVPVLDSPPVMPAS